MITLVGAVAIAAEIILISAWAGKVDVKRVTVVQLATASLVAFFAMVPAGNLCRRCLPGLWWLLAGDLQRHYSGDDELGAAQRFRRGQRLSTPVSRSGRACSGALPGSVYRCWRWWARPLLPGCW
jgi:hypothetical protein